MKPLVLKGRFRLWHFLCFLLVGVGMGVFGFLSRLESKAGSRQDSERVGSAPLGQEGPCPRRWQAAPDRRTWAR
eukprot:16437507-Heterocapsa_arctica.AAC.1